MKNSNKSTITTGIVLLCVAAFFTISLMLQALDFGVAASGENNIFYMLGNILYNVYGFSSILIPVFLFISGLSCFATKWSARKTMRLLTAIVPFFTAVITENICRSILALEHSVFPGVKVFVAVVTGVMLIIIEFLGAGIIADKINPILFGNKKPVAKRKPEATVAATETDTQPQTEEDSESEESHDITFGSIGKLNTSNLIFGKKEEEASESADNNFTSVNADEIEEIDDVEDVSEENKEAETPAEETHEDSDGIKTEVSSVFDKALSEVETPEITEESDNQDYAEPSASIITEEEYAALTDFGSDEPEQTEEPEEELEWNNLPPKQDTLPPDYDEDYSENDPALDFPPKDDEVENIEDVTEEVSEDSENPFTAFEVDLTEAQDEEDAYSTTKYIDSVVENPNFSHGITLREGELPEEDTEEKKTSEPEKPKFPSRINLSESEEEPENDSFHVVGRTSFVPATFDETKEPELEEETEPQFEELPQQSTYTPSTNQDKISQASANSSALYAASHEKKNDVFGNNDVFAQMENDIRKESLQKLSEETEQAYLNGELNQESEEETEEPDLTGANDLTADGSEEIEAMTEEFDADGAEHDATFEEESIAFDDEVNQDYKDTDAFALEEEPEPEKQQIMANPPRIGNRATKKGPYVIPSDLLTAYKDDQYWIIDDATKESALNLTNTLAEFNIEAKVIQIKKGPVVTMFEILPAPGVRLQKIVALQDNIALSLAAQSVRIVAPIPGKQAVGIEVPNRHRSIVGFREIIEMKLDEWDKMAVPVVLGKDILGKAQLIDLVKTPHMLIAGATGSGKSVCVNSLILSILYKRSYRDVKLILVDPKVVELKLYNNIPHLLVPVITEPKKALQALQWCLCEMERRYALLDSMGVRDISTYNQRIKEREIATEKLPYIVVIIDEFADLMATSGRELESTVARLTAMSRAVGIHLVLATQRPSVNVITGLIKANIPSRIAFMVSSRTDSNIIIDSVGAEKLLGRGDMLYASAVDPAPVRIQGTYISDQEVEDVVRAVKEYGEPDYIDDQVFYEEEESEDFELNGDYEGDPLYDQALEIVIQSGKASASYLQRRLSIGYNRAARLVEEMEDRGIVGPANGSKPREIIHIPG